MREWRQKQGANKLFNKKTHFNLQRNKSIDVISLMHHA